MNTTPERPRFDLHHPHDSLVKFILGIAANMADFLKTYLPKPLSEPILWEELRIEPASFMSEALKASYSDLLVSSRFAGHDLRVYLIVEHKSSQEEDTLHQILDLLAALVSRLRRENPSKGFTPALALILHHGARPWKGSLRMLDHYDLPERFREAFQPHLLGYTPILVDLQAVRMEDIHNAPPVEAALKALKSVSENSEEQFLEELKGLAGKEEMKPYLATLLLYVLCAGKGIAADQVLAVAKSTQNDRVVSEVMTGAEILIERGRLAGRQEGRQEGWQEGVEEGEARGHLTGQIAFVEGILGRKTRTFQEYRNFTLEELQGELDRLKAEWSKKQPR